MVDFIRYGQPSPRKVVLTNFSGIDFPDPQLDKKAIEKKPLSPQANRALKSIHLIQRIQNYLGGK